jgi:hypothetical protein
MPDDAEPLEEISQRERIDKLEGSRFGWRLLTICCVGVWLFSKSQTHVTYVFHIYDEQIEMTKSQWFHKNKTVLVTWRKDSDGEPGWCAKGENGQWNRVIVEHPDY